MHRSLSDTGRRCASPFATRLMGLGDCRPTFIKLHLEGGELAALKGARQDTVIESTDRHRDRLSQCGWNMENAALAHGNIARLSLSVPVWIRGVEQVP